MAFFAKIFGKYLPANASEKAQVGGTVARLKGIHEHLADTIEAVEKLDVVEALQEASPWAEATGAALGDALPPVRFVLKLFEELTKVDDPGELGYLAATLAYQRAVEQALPEFLTTTPSQEIEVKTRKKVLQELRKAAPPEAYDFTRFSFENAINHPFVKDADRFLELSATGLGLDEPGFLKLQHQVHLRFIPNLKGILSHGSTRERFAPFRELMALDTSEARALDALLEHADYQRWLYEEKPVLGREPFTLAQVYVETECGVLRWEEVGKGRGRKLNIEPGSDHVDPFDEEHGGRQPLVDTILDLIADPTFKDAIVLQGVAGSGKSSLTLRLAWELVRLGLRPIRIELKHLDTRESAAIEEALPEAVRITEDERTLDAEELVFGEDLFLGGAIFKESILFRDTKICPYVLILDGWDEISVGASEGYQQQVERMLGDVRREFLANRAFPVRVILTGRPTDAVEASKFLRADTRLLTVRNLSPAQLESYVDKVKNATAAAAKRDPKSWSLENIGQLSQVLGRYREEYEKEDDKHRRGIMTPSAGSFEILGLPLLAHLALRLLAEHPEDAEQLLADTTALYRNLVDLVIGQAGKPAEADFEVDASAMLAGEELRDLLRGTAEAMTALGQESISHDELAVRLNLDEDELTRKVGGLTSGQVLSRLMISFFFKGGHSELGAEFSHKSFREYLFAEQVVEELKRYGREAPPNLPERPHDQYWKDFDEDDVRRGFCHRLAELLGPVWMTPEVARHLQWLLSREISNSKEQDLELWDRIRDGLADAWDWWGEGVHLRPQPKQRSGYRTYDTYEKPVAVRVVEDGRWRSDPKRRPLPGRTTTVDAHLGDGLVLLASLVHVMIAVKRGWQSDVKEDGVITSIRRYQSHFIQTGEPFILFAPSGGGMEYFSYYCARINAGGYRPQGTFPSGATLMGVEMNFSLLEGAILQHVELSGARLAGALLNGAELFGAKLRKADLSNANLRRAGLSGANLHQAYMVQAVLYRADLSESVLRGANLSGAQLSEAKIDNADLSETILTEADLRNADLSGALLFGADLSNTDLRGADLRSTDLRQANLDGANLAGTDFCEADLRGARVTDEQLELANIEGAVIDAR